MHQKKHPKSSKMPILNLDGNGNLFKIKRRKPLIDQDGLVLESNTHTKAEAAWCVFVPVIKHTIKAH